MVVSQPYAGEEPLELNGIRFRFSVPPHHQDFKHTEIILLNGCQDRKFDDGGGRNRGGYSAKEDEDQRAGYDKRAWHRRAPSRLVALVCLVCLVCLVKRTNQIDQMNQINHTRCRSVTRPLSKV